MKKIINWILNILIIIVVLAIGYLLFINYRNHKIEEQSTAEALQQYDEVTCKQDQVKEDTSNPILTNDDANANELIGYIMFPTLGKSSSLVQGDVNDGLNAALNLGVSHDPRSAMPGETGNTVLAGHREYFFSNFSKLKEGDSVIININNNVYVYQIDSFEIIDPTDVDKVFYEGDENDLIMYTCYPFKAYTPITNRYVVKAHRIKKTTVKNCKTVTKTKEISNSEK